MQGTRGGGHAGYLATKRGRAGMIFTLCRECEWISYRRRWEGGGEVKNSASYFASHKIQRCHHDFELLFTRLLVKNEVCLCTVSEMSSSCGKCQNKKAKKTLIIYNNLPGSVYKCHINVSVLPVDADSSFKYFPDLQVWLLWSLLPDQSDQITQHISLDPSGTFSSHSYIFFNSVFFS